MSTLLHDFRIALRSLLRTPVFSLMALLTLALGIGANSAVFSVIKAVFLKPLPFAQPDGLVYLHVEGRKLFPDIPYLPLSAPCYRALREGQQVFSDMAAYRDPGRVILTGQGDADRVLNLEVTGSFFQVLGSKPALGRTLLPSDDGGAKVVVLAHDFWKTRFGGDPSILGRTLTLGGQGHTVVGVMPSTFAWQGQPQLFTADGPTPEQMRDRWTDWMYHGIARLKPSATLAQAEAALAVVSQDVAKRMPQPSQVNLAATGLWTYLYGGQRATGLLLLLTGGFVLLIASANLANLMVSRAAYRQREMAIRRALGGGWRDELRPFLAEGLVLSLAGGALGLLLALALSGLLRPFVPLELQGAAGLDPWLLLFTFGLSLLTALVCGFAPLVLASRRDLATALSHSSKTASGGSQGWLRNGLITAQVALSLALLVSFGALWQSLRKLQQAPLGYEPDRALTFLLSPDLQKYSEWKPHTSYIRQVARAISDLPGVAGVGVASHLPPEAGTSASYELPGRKELALTAYLRSLSPGSLEALGMGLLRGRDFVETDCLEEPDNILVNRALAERCWPGEDPIGKTLVRGRASGPGILRVVGLVADVRHRGPRADRNLDTIYYPAYGGFLSDSVRIVVRAKGDPMALLSGLREHLKAVDPNLPLTGIQTLRSRLDARLEDSRTQTMLLGLLAGIALCLASAGIYGVMAHAVAQRTREIGIRKALGGQTGRVVWDISRRGLPVIAFGLGLGALLTLASGQLLASFIYGVSATEPLSIALAALVLGLVALTAALLPASRAARIEPAVALRSE